MFSCSTACGLRDRHYYHPRLAVSLKFTVEQAIRTRRCISFMTQNILTCKNYIKYILQCEKQSQATMIERLIKILDNLNFICKTKQVVLGLVCFDQRKFLSILHSSLPKKSHHACQITRNKELFHSLRKRQDIRSTVNNTVCSLSLVHVSPAHQTHKTIEMRDENMQIRHPRKVNRAHRRL